MKDIVFPLHNKSEIQVNIFCYLPDKHFLNIFEVFFSQYTVIFIGFSIDISLYIIWIRQIWVTLTCHNSIDNQISECIFCNLR